jgi:hypothetical protein
VPGLPHVLDQGEHQLPAPLNINGAQYIRLIVGQLDINKYDWDEIDPSLMLPGAERDIERSLVGATPELLVGRTSDRPMWVRSDLHRPDLEWENR